MNYAEFQRSRRIAKLEKKISALLDKSADSFLHKEAKEIDSLVNHGHSKTLSTKMRIAKNHKSYQNGATGESRYTPSKLCGGEARAINKVEKVVSKQVQLDRETIADKLQRRVYSKGLWDALEMDK